MTLDPAGLWDCSKERRYTAYGIRLLANGAIPGLQSLSDDRACDVRVWLKAMPAGPWRESIRISYQSPWLNESGRPNLIIWRTEPQGALYFQYDDQTEFLIREDGREIWCAWPEKASISDTAVYLRGPILAMVLRLHGRIPLHASAIAVSGAAITLLGSAGSGKSTTSAAFVQLGYSILSDDVAALHEAGGGFFVLPGCRWIKLWPEAAEALFGTQTSLPRLTPADGINNWWDKRYLDVESTQQFHREPLRLAAVYFLAERSLEKDVPYIRPLCGQDAFMTLVNETYVNYALDRSLRQHEFRVLGRLARTTPVRRVTAPANHAGLPDLCKAILRDFSEVSSKRTRGRD